MPFVDDAACLRIKPAPETQRFIKYQSFGTALTVK
jgi:hypothetical protein